ncbi:hypothetical protein GCM10011383_29750 [Hymenobacter cavernae]|uniref:Ferritin-like domain-containing protein n=1 Tax=Hymenobacter cavernae TaxID=2044852 RepID=A0ABQ1UFW7_9BACT|nr:hypothetical protein GCM10011383_29750 [Hymenobacter cavernae]
MALTGLLLAGCDDDDSTDHSAAFVDVGSGDLGVLNYAYALEQLEYAFYTQVKNGAYYKGLGASSVEKQILDDLAFHEKAHVDLFRNALGSNAIKDLEPDFSTINFDDRSIVLGTARAFEDTGVAAYNGAARYFETPTYLPLAGKIVSVEARHAALIRDILSFNAFVATDVVDLYTPAATGGIGAGAGSGLERSLRPALIVNAVNQYLQVGSKLNVSKFV